MEHLVSTPRVELMRELRSEIEHDFAHGRVIIAVDGMTGSGTREFADEFARVCRETRREVFRASIQDFHRPRTERYVAGRDSPEGYYRDSFDYRTFRRVLIDPFAMAGSTGFQTASFDTKRDALVLSSWRTADADAVLIVDGIFLLRPELREMWNYSVLLDVPPAVAYERLALSDARDANPDAPSNARYMLGQRLYRDEVDPLHAASAVVDNVNSQQPVRIFPTLE